MTKKIIAGLMFLTTSIAYAESPAECFKKFMALPPEMTKDLVSRGLFRINYLGLSLCQNAGLSNASPASCYAEAIKIIEEEDGFNKQNSAYNLCRIDFR